MRAYQNGFSNVENKIESVETLSESSSAPLPSDIVTFLVKVLTNLTNHILKQMYWHRVKFHGGK